MKCPLCRRNTVGVALVKSGTTQLSWLESRNGKLVTRIDWDYETQLRMFWSMRLVSWFPCTRIWLWMSIATVSCKFYSRTPFCPSCFSRMVDLRFGWDSNAFVSDPSHGLELFRGLHSKEMWVWAMRLTGFKLRCSKRGIRGSFGPKVAQESWYQSSYQNAQWRNAVGE